MPQTQRRLENQLIEYKELRSEIRHYLERREKNVQFALVLTIAIVGAGSELRSSFLFLISALLMAFIWYDEARTISAVFRVATYIKIFIEQTADGLDWETYGSFHPIQTSIFKRIIANGVFPLMFLIHSVFALQLANWPQPWIIITSAGLGIVCISLIYESYKTLKHGRSQELKRWRRIKQESYSNVVP